RLRVRVLVEQIQPLTRVARYARKPPSPPRGEGQKGGCIDVIAFLPPTIWQTPCPAGFRGDSREFRRIVTWKKRTAGQTLPRAGQSLTSSESIRRRDQLLLNSAFRFERWFCNRWTMLECIWLTRLSLRLSVAPISFIVISS